MSADIGSPRPWFPADSFNGALIRGLVRNQLCICGGSMTPPADLTCKQLRVGIRHTVGLDSGGINVFNREACLTLAEFFGVVGTDSIRSGTAARRAVADRLEFEHPGDRPFRKPELQQMLREAVKLDIQRQGGER